MPVHLRTDSPLLPLRPDLRQGKQGILEKMLQSAFYQSSSDLAAWYSRSGTSRDYSLAHSLGIYDVPETIYAASGWLDFIHHCRESLVVNRKKGTFLEEILINPAMNSGYVIPLFENMQISDILILNSISPDSFGSKKCHDLQSLSRICSDLLF